MAALTKAALLPEPRLREVRVQWDSEGIFPATEWTFRHDNGSVGVCLLQARRRRVLQPLVGVRGAQAAPGEGFRGHTAVVLVTELKRNAGPSTTNTVGPLAASACAALGLDREALRWLEQYEERPDPYYDQAFFDGSWRHLQDEEARLVLPALTGEADALEALLRLLPPRKRP